jgi:hypothetical protein
MRIFAHTAAVALLCALLSAPIHADPHKTVKAANRDKTSWLFIRRPMAPPSMERRSC